jgi:hypothetical protein
MADKAGGDAGAGGEEEKEGEPKKTCGEKYESCIIVTCKVTD